MLCQAQSLEDKVAYTDNNIHLTLHDAGKGASPLPPKFIK